MRKSLLIAVAAIFVAVGANAQAKRVAKATRVSAPESSMAQVQFTRTSDMVVKKNKKNVVRKAVADIASDYILEYANYTNDFVASSSFSIEEASGTTKVYNLETDEDDVDFKYNVKLINFTLEDSESYGFYHEDEGYIEIPVQTIDNDDTYGRIVLSGVSSLNEVPQHIGFDIILNVDEDGSLSLYDAEEELSENYPGEYMSGYYNFLPDDEEGGAWNAGFEIEFYTPNSAMFAYEDHVGGNGWTGRSWKAHPVYIEDLDDEIVVHNFLDLIPLSVSVEGDQYTIQLPVYVGTYEFPTYGREAIWILNPDETSEEVLVKEGTIVGSAFTDEVGSGFRFFDLEEREAWTDENGEHEAGTYYVNNTSFYIGAIDATGYGYWTGGDFRYVSVYVPSTTGITNITNANNVNKDAKTYNLAGQQVGKDYKGIVIKNGVKTIQK